LSRRRSKGSILTKFIKPKQPSPNGDKDSLHRSIVILKEHFTTKNGKECYRFSFVDEADNDNATILEANCRYVKIEEEGKIDGFFSEMQKEKRKLNDLEAKKFKEPKVKWEKSRAKKLLYDDIVEGRVPLDPKDDDDGTMNLKGIYRTVRGQNIQNIPTRSFRVGLQVFERQSEIL
jgi:hypothetical protein